MVESNPIFTFDNSDYFDGRDLLAVSQALVRNTAWGPVERLAAMAVAAVRADNGRLAHLPREFWDNVNQIRNTLEPCDAGNAVKKRLARLFRLIDEERGTEAIKELTSLKLDLGECTPDIIRAETMIGFWELDVVPEFPRMRPVVEAAEAWCRFRAAGVVLAKAKLHGMDLAMVRGDYDGWKDCWEHKAADPLAKPPGRRLPTGGCYESRCPGLDFPPATSREWI